MPVEQERRETKKDRFIIEFSSTGLFFIKSTELIPRTNVDIYSSVVQATANTADNVHGHHIHCLHNKEVIIWLNLLFHSSLMKTLFTEVAHMSSQLRAVGKLAHKNPDLVLHVDHVCGFTWIQLTANSLTSWQRCSYSSLQFSPTLCLFYAFSMRRGCFTCMGDCMPLLWPMDPI